MIAPLAGASEVAAAPDRARVDPQLEKATLGFERMLLTQLLKPLADAAGEDAPAAYKDLLPQTLADAVAEGGGIGLASELQRALVQETR
ncbi:MAG: rod-binding protein [Thermoleophilaceae bacterium]